MLRPPSLPRRQTLALAAASTAVVLPALVRHVEGAGALAGAIAWTAVSALAFWAGVGAHFRLRDARTVWLRVAWLGAFLELDISLRYRVGWALAAGALLLAVAAIPNVARRAQAETCLALGLAAAALSRWPPASPAFVTLGPACLFAARSGSRGLRALTPVVVWLGTLVYTSAWPDPWLRGWREGFATKSVAAALLVAGGLVSLAGPSAAATLRARTSGPALASGLGYVALALCWTHPLAFELGDVIAHDAGDPMLNAWIVWWNAQSVPFTQAWWNAPIFHPAGGSFALSEHLLGLAPLTTPLQWMGVSAAAAYNLAFLLSIPFSAGAAHALCHRLTGRHDAALLGGLAYGFAPFRVSHLAHIQVLTTWTIPLCLLGLHAYLETRRARWLLLFGAAWALLGLTNGYYLLYLPVLFLMWIAWFSRGWRPLLAVGAALLAGIVPSLPALWGYHALHARSGLARTSEDVRLGSAVLASFGEASPLLLTSGWRERTFASAEGWLFPGLAILALAAAGLAHAWWRGGLDRKRIAFYGIAAVFLWWLCLGPEVRARPDGAVLAPGPFALLLQLPGYVRLRSPARFALLAALCLAVAGSLAAARLFPATRRGRAVLGLAAAGVLAEGWIAPLPLVRLPPRAPLLESLGSVATAVLEVPLGEWAEETAAMHRATYHRRPLVNGFSGYTPPHYVALSAGLLAYDEDTLGALGEQSALAVMLDGTRDQDGRFARFLESSPRVREWRRDGRWRVFLLAHRPSPPPPAAQALALARVRASLRDEDVRFLTDGALATRWTADRPQFGEEVVEAELAAPGAVSGAVLSLGPSREDYPRRLVIETSLDGTRWTPAWEGTGYAPTIRAALRDPRVVPVLFDFAARPARRVRLRQTGSDPAKWWSIAELEVLGPAPQAASAAAGWQAGHQ